MGNWNRRYPPRKKYKSYNYYYDDPPSTQYGKSHSSDFGYGNAPSWEKEYCHSVGVPWRKVVASKNYSYCHPNVINWDDSAGEEALNDAKKRHWATINGLPFEKSLPDPDMYIDKVDWNAHIDAVLMQELDKQFFNPDELDKLETIKEEEQPDNGCALTEERKKNDNPWERNEVQGTGDVKNVHGWNQWDSSANLDEVDNPWEPSNNQIGVSLKDNAWSSGDDGWGQNQWLQNTDRSAAVGFGSGNPWNSNVQSTRQNGWGSRDTSSWGWNQGVTSSEELRRWGNHGNAWENSITAQSGYSKEKGWQEQRDKSWGWKQPEHQNNGPNYWDSGRFKRGGGRPFNGGYRKRESSPQHTSSRYKNSRWQPDNLGGNRRW